MARSQGREPREGAELTPVAQTPASRHAREPAVGEGACRLPGPWVTPRVASPSPSIGGQVTPLWGCLFPHIFSHPSVLEISLTLKVTSFRILASTTGLSCPDEFMAFPSLG